MGVLSQYEPKKVLEFFELLSSVPHGSGNTTAIADICERFAIERNLKYYRDEYNNVIIYKEASEGVSSDPVILQGHLDMVCVKENELDLDMQKEPITLMTDGKYIRADRTSLGADDTIAVAIALAILDDDALKHPPICAVFTVDEETSMNGARMLDKSKIIGNRLINLDSEEEGFITCGCAGAIKADCRFPVIREPVKSDDCFYTINVSGLLGGHSGRDIKYNRANAIILLSRVIYGLSLKWNIRICSFNGGQFDNSIPVSAEAVIAVPENQAEDALRLGNKHQILFSKEFSESDKDVLLSISPAEPAQFCLSEKTTKVFTRCIISVPNGLRSMSDKIDGLPSVSSNIGIAGLNDSVLHFISFIRSNEPGKKEEIFDMMKSCVEHDGGNTVILSEFPEWEFKEESPLRELFLSEYEKLFNVPMRINATHGGLETALFAAENKNFDIVSLGPEIKDIHSTREKTEIESIRRLYTLLTEVLKKL